MKQLLSQIASKNNLQLVEASALAGGDINDVYVLSCTTDKYVVKINDAHKFPGMFEAEAKGLQLLEASNSFAIPHVINYGKVNGTSYLLLEFISAGKSSDEFWQLFADNLAKLHKTTQTYFGLDHANYIGSLPQSNTLETTASDFFIRQRLEPQFKLAVDAGFKFSSIDAFYKNISVELPNEPPALIHGDLWSGNYLITTTGEPVLIDPSVSFSIRELDLAMMQLFGGFSPDVYTLYNELYPLEQNWRERISIWQLYYLLVHLNLFGRGYLSQVQSILKQFL